MTRKGEVKFIDRVKLRECADQVAAAFAMEPLDAVLAGQRLEKSLESLQVKCHFRVCGGIEIAGDQQVDCSARFVEKRLLEVEFAGPRDHAAQRLEDFSRPR